MDWVEVRLWSSKCTRIPGPGVSVVVKGSSCPVLLQIRANPDPQKSTPWYFYLASLHPPSPTRRPCTFWSVIKNNFNTIIKLNSFSFLYFIRKSSLAYVNKANTHSTSEKWSNINVEHIFMYIKHKLYYIYTTYL